MLFNFIFLLCLMIKCKKRENFFQKKKFIAKAVTNLMGIAEAMREVINDDLSFIFRNQFFDRN